MNLFKLKGTLVLFSLCSLNLMAQNFYVKETWETQTAILGSQHYFASTILDANGEVSSVANKRNNSEADIFLNRINGNGTVTWQNTISNLLNISTTQNYGTDIKRDQQGNTYISGAYFNGANYDLIVVKYNNSGTELWRRVYNGTGNYDDAAANFVLDASGNVYVTGASYGVNTLTDIVTLKINGSNGAIIWTARYDFNSKYEGGSQVRLDSQGNVFVGGSSAQNNFNADFVAIKYNPTTGAQMQVKRQNTPLNGYDIAIGMEIDQNNNVYLYGSANYNVNRDIKLVSYDANLNINWIKYYDAAGLEDEAGGLTIGTDGNPIITGYIKNSQGQIKMLTAKYNKVNGNLLWMQQHETTLELTESKGKKVKVDNDGNVIAAGEVRINGVSHVKLISYDPSGNVRWEHVKKNTSLSDQQALDLIVHGNDIFLTGVEQINSDPNLFTVKLQPKEIVVVPDFAGESPRAAYGLETNAGQLLDDLSASANNVKFYNDRMNPAVFMTENNFSLAFQQGQEDKTIAVHRVDMDFINSYPVKKLINLQQEELHGLKNYYLQHIPTGTIGIKDYSRVIMADVYENIDVTYYSNANGMKYYINVKPNANPDNIIIQFTGADGITLNQDGSLDVHSAYGSITFNKPIAYQIDGSNNPVHLSNQGNFIQISPLAVKFEVKEFDHSKNLFLQLGQEGSHEDPVRSDNLKWSTYYGGANFDEFTDNTVDENGDVYFTGSSHGLNFPRLTGNTNVYQSSVSVRRIVCGKHQSGGERVWSTLYGAEMDIANSIAADIEGNVFVAGVSSYNQNQHHFIAVNKPGAYNQGPVNPAPNINSYAFIIKFAQSNGVVDWATLFGENATGSLYNASSVSCDPSGNVFIAGQGKRVANAPLLASGSQYFNGENNVSKGFIVKFDGSNYALDWSTLFGNNNTYIRGIHAYGHGALLVTGETGSTNISNFPLVEEHPGGDYMQSYAGGSSDAFVAYFNTGNVLTWSTLFGGNGMDVGNSISLSPNGDIAICGKTGSSANFPLQMISNGYTLNTLHGTQDGFLTVIDPTLTGYELEYSTYWGWDKSDEINKVRYSKTGDLYCTGTSNSIDLRNLMTVMSGAYRQDYLEDDANFGLRSNAFLIGLNPVYDFKWSTYFGGSPNSNFPYSTNDEGLGISVLYNKLYISGATNSQLNFPLMSGDPGAYFQDENGSGFSTQSDDDNYSDGFIAEFDLTLTELGTTIGIEELAMDLMQNAYVLFPNPTTDKAFIVSSSEKNSKIETVEIFDINGKSMKKITNFQAQNSKVVSLDIEDLPTGFYTVVLSSGDANTALKLVKK